MSDVIEVDAADLKLKLIGRYLPQNEELMAIGDLGSIHTRARVILLEVDHGEYFDKSTGRTGSVEPGRYRIDDNGLTKIEVAE